MSLWWLSQLIRRMSQAAPRKQRRTAGRPRPGAKITLEALEDRRLPSAAAPMVPVYHPAVVHPPVSHPPVYHPAAMVNGVMQAAYTEAAYTQPAYTDPAYTSWEPAPTPAHTPAVTPPAPRPSVAPPAVRQPAPAPAVSRPVAPPAALLAFAAPAAAPTTRATPPPAAAPAPDWFRSVPAARQAEVAQALQQGRIPQWVQDVLHEQYVQGSFGGSGRLSVATAQVPTEYTSSLKSFAGDTQVPAYYTLPDEEARFYRMLNPVALVNGQAVLQSGFATDVVRGPDGLTQVPKQNILNAFNTGQIKTSADLGTFLQADFWDWIATHANDPIPTIPEGALSAAITVSPQQMQVVMMMAVSVDDGSQAPDPGAATQPDPPLPDPLPPAPAPAPPEPARPAPAPATSPAEDPSASDGSFHSGASPEPPAPGVRPETATPARGEAPSAPPAPEAPVVPLLATAERARPDQWKGMGAGASEAGGDTAQLSVSARLLPGSSAEGQGAAAEGPNDSAHGGPAPGPTATEGDTPTNATTPAGTPDAGQQKLYAELDQFLNKPLPPSSSAGPSDIPMVSPVVPDAAPSGDARAEVTGNGSGVTLHIRVETTAQGQGTQTSARDSGSPAPAGGQGETQAPQQKAGTGAGDLLGDVGQHFMDLGPQLDHGVDAVLNNPVYQAAAGTVAGTEATLVKSTVDTAALAGHTVYGGGLSLVAAVGPISAEQREALNDQAKEQLTPAAAVVNAAQQAVTHPDTVVTSVVTSARQTGTELGDLAGKGRYAELGAKAGSAVTTVVTTTTGVMGAGKAAANLATAAAQTVKVAVQAGKVSTSGLAPAAAAGMAGLTKKLTGTVSTEAAGTAAGEAWPDPHRVYTAPYSELKTNLKGPNQQVKGLNWQANHLNQDSVYRAVQELKVRDSSVPTLQALKKGPLQIGPDTVIARGRIPSRAGAAHPAFGNILTQPGTTHRLFHESLEAWWDQFRDASGAPKPGARWPTNGEYGRAVFSALRKAGFSPEEAYSLWHQARENRLAHGLPDFQSVPRIPKPIWRKGR